MKLIGYDAIDHAERTGMALNQADEVDRAAHQLTITEAEAIATEAPERVWLVVADDEP